MVDDELSDGVRLGQLLSSEIHGHERGSLGRLSVVDADADVEPTAEGAFAFAVAFEDRPDREAERIAAVFVHPERVRVEFIAGLETAVEAAVDEGLRAEREDSEPARTLVSVTNGAAVKDALRVVRRVADDLRQDAT